MKTINAAIREKLTSQDMEYITRAVETEEEREARQMAIERNQHQGIIREINSRKTITTWEILVRVKNGWVSQYGDVITSNGITTTAAEKDVALVIGVLNTDILEYPIDIPLWEECRNGCEYLPFETEPDEWIWKTEAEENEE